MQGDTPVLRIMGGDTRVWPSGNSVAIDAVLTNITSSVSLPASVALNGSFTVTLTANVSHIINQISITMGSVDITSTAYNDGVITIAEVTDDVLIVASALEVITFQDAAVKAICVQYWGGSVIGGEITPTEAASVHNLGLDKDGNEIADGAGPFYANSTITSFNEFRYFTGLTTPGMFWKNTGSTVYTNRGKFSFCSLKEITIPPIPTRCLSGLLYSCSNLEEVDLSSLQFVGTSENDRRISSMFHGCTAIKKIIFPLSANYVVSTTSRIFGYQSSNSCPNLEYVDFRQLDFSEVPTTSGSPAHILRYCTNLAHLPSGMYNLKHTQSFAYNPLTHESAVALLNSLGTVTGQTITFKATTYQTLTAEEIAIGTNKGWTVASA